MLYDSQCPLCMHEINFLERRNTAGLVKFTDIASPGYKPEDNGGVDYEAGMKKIHAVLDTGEVLAQHAMHGEDYGIGVGIVRVPKALWAGHWNVMAGRIEGFVFDLK